MDNGHVLPTTDPASGVAERSDRPKTYCLKLVVQHDMREAGESRWAPWGALFATRLLSGLTFIALVLLVLRFPLMPNLPLLAGLSFSGLTYLGLAVCTLLQGKGARASRKSGLSTAVVFLHSITAALALFFITDFVAVVVVDIHFQGFGFQGSSLIALTPLMAYLLDVLVMQSRIRLRYRYSLFFLILSALYTIIVSVVLAVATVGYPLGPLIGFLVGVHVGLGLVASLIAVLLTRISWPCFKN